MMVVGFDIDDGGAVAAAAGSTHAHARTQATVAAMKEKYENTIASLKEKHAHELEIAVAAAVRLA